MSPIMHTRPLFAGRILSRTINGTCKQFPIASTSPTAAARAAFSSSAKLKAKNQIYATVRNPDQFNTYLLLSSSSRTRLLTLWTTNWCPTCKVVGPLLQSLVESGVGEAEGGVGYCAVEFDAPDVMAGGLGLTYMINSVPTLLSFDAGEAQVATKLADGNKLSDRRFLEEWIRTEARRHGGRGGGGPTGGAAFGGLFSGWKR